MAQEGKTATHPDPVWREKANYIIRAELTSHGLAGGFEQLWTRTEDRTQFEVCCIPFFPYGISLGDIVTWEATSHRVEVTVPSGRRTLRIAFRTRADIDHLHSRVHGELVQAGFLVEWNSSGYGAVDLAEHAQFELAPQLLAPYVEQNNLSWEWANPPQEPTG